MKLFEKKTVPKATYETAIRERDAFEQEVAQLQQQVAALVINEDVLRRLVQKATRLLERVSTTHRASPNFKREIDALVAEVKSAGVIEEKGAEHVAEHPAPVETTSGQARTETHD